MTFTLETENKYVEHLEKIDRLLKKYAQDYHFYLRDLRSGQEFELGTKKAYPICSCFKLAVLMAFFDSLETEARLHEEVVIPPEEFSPGGGVLNYLTTPVKFTYFQLCQLMMSFSDGTATDLLIDRVGIDKIETELKRHAPSSTLSMNLRQMVLDFQSRFNITELKSKDRIAKYDFSDVTNASDLESLIYASVNFKPQNVSQRLYFECLDVKKLLPRCALFLDNNYKIIGKTGSLGHTFFANDCGVIIHNKVSIASFGICCVGFKQDKDVAELIFGLIGLEILGLIGEETTPNARFTLHTRSILEP